MSTTEPDRAELVAVTDHVATGLALLTPEYRRPAIQALGRSWLEQVQLAEDALWSVWLIAIDTAVGDQLDQIGEVLVTPRAGLGDTPYRAVLRAAALAIGSSGTGDEVSAVLDALAIDTALPWRPAGPATVVVEPAAAGSIPAAAMFGVLRRAASAGVRLDLVDVPEGELFTFSSTDATQIDAPRGFSDTTGVTGGKLVGVITA